MCVSMRICALIQCLLTCLFVFMCVCEYERVCVCVCVVHACVFTCACMWTHACGCAFKRACQLVHTCVHALCACMLVRACGCLYCLSVHESWWQGKLELRLGWEGDRDGGRALLSVLPYFIFGNRGQPRSLKIII